MSRDFSPQELDHGLPDLADLRPIDREFPEKDGRTAVFRALRHLPERVSRDRVAESRFAGARALVSRLGSSYHLSESEIRTIIELGRFRIISRHDLAQHGYGGNREQADSDLESLLHQRLVRRGVFEGPEASPRELLTLTKTGRELIRTNGLASREAVYEGFARPREANHDADLYRLYQKEAARIEDEGGRNLRVILECALKENIRRDIARLGAAAQREIAAWHGLRVVGNKIPVPDLRIEYETQNGELARVDLELVTEHYAGRDTATKVRAGFSLYTPHGEAGRLRRVLDARGMRPDILCL
ncbi:MAG: hypothetical protein HRJ53_16680 [Acidobacteria bacterium Pan2503]|uniref:Uncharacterized protein n=1 Tax=Candidatus Acidiferrum panamense TaxID=2741543 RepID=A0A7V8NSF1_9BACT|nr:hypothetical protein [Candidatus Acidoferrum panamensis]